MWLLGHMLVIIAHIRLDGIWKSKGSDQEVFSMMGLRRPAA
jgi:hypothetical protein